MKTRKDELQDLTKALTNHLVGTGRDVKEVKTFAINWVKRVDKDKTSIEDIRKMRDMFL